MVPATLALLSALAFGLNHFWGGVLSRRRDPWAVAMIGQFAGLAATTAAAWLVGGDPDAGDLLWGAASGLGSGLGVAMLYRAMSIGNVSIVVPVSDVGAVAIPVLVGVLALGERPPPVAWVGIALALPALWAISRGEPDDGDSRGITEAVVAGIGFAVQFLAIAQASPSAGIWPVAAARVGSILVVGGLLLRRRVGLRMPRPDMWQAFAVGVLGSLGLTLYLLATRQQLLVLATVLSSLYPAIPVVLALLLLKERLTRTQTLGLGTALGAIACLSLG